MNPCIPNETIKDRMEILRHLVRNGDVLDLGVVDSWPEHARSSERIEGNPDLLFRQIATLNPNVLGVDIDREGIDLLKSKGYNVECADVETMDLGRKFDAIIAGEIIEHLENPGSFLRNARRHIKSGGVLAISTPNPFYAKQLHKIWRYHRPDVHDEHTCWFDPVTLDQLMRRTSWEPCDSYWVQPERKLLKTWIRLLRGYFAHSFLMVARPST